MTTSTERGLGEQPYRRVLRGLARQILRLQPGQNLPTTERLQDELNVAAGTVQKAIANLTEAGVIEVTSHGHKGRALRSYSLGMLWPLAEFPVVRVEVPAVGSIEMLHLREALEDGFGANGVPIAISSTPGAAIRVQRLQDGDASIVAVSSGFWESLPDAVRMSSISRAMGEDTYYAQDSIKVVNKQGWVDDGRQSVRIGIDWESHDHRSLTLAEYPPSSRVEYVNCGFPTIPVDVIEGTIDVGLWHEAPTMFKPEHCGLEISSLTSLSAKALRRSLSEAMFLVRADGLALYNALELATQSRTVPQQ